MRIHIQYLALGILTFALWGLRPVHAAEPAPAESYAATLRSPMPMDWEAKAVAPDAETLRANFRRNAAVPESLPTYALRVAYVIPNNRVAQPTAIANIRYAVSQYVDFYKDQMDRFGFGAKSYQPETEADNTTIKVYTINGGNPDTYYNVNPYSRVTFACTFNGLPVFSDKQVWLVFFEGVIMSPDGSVTGVFNGGSNPGSGDDGGLGMTVGSWMTLATPANLIDNTPYNGLTISGWGAYPMVYDLTRPWFEGDTKSSLSSVGLGAAQHELEHGLGAAHDMRNDVNFHGNVLGNGFRGYRGYARNDLYPADEMRMSYAAALEFNLSRYFNTATAYSDNTAPLLTVNSSGSVGAVGGLLPLSFTASDAGTLALAHLRLDGNTVEELILSGTSTTTSFNTAWYTEGAANTFAISVWDTSGNRTDSADFVISVPSGTNAAPRPSITVKPSTATVGQSIVIDCSLSADPDSSFSTVKVEWDLDGNGTFDTAQTTTKNRTITYATAGVRTIRARLTDAGGAQSVSTPIGVRVVEATPVRVSRWEVD